MPPQIQPIFSPTLVLGEDQLVFSMTGKGAERRLASGRATLLNAGRRPAHSPRWHVGSPKSWCSCR